jgi:hypothetical protein
MVKFNFNSSLATVIAVVPTVCSMAQEKPEPEENIDDVPEDFKQELKELIDMMFLTGNVFSENKEHIEFMHSEISDEVKDDH